VLAAAIALGVSLVGPPPALAADAPASCSSSMPVSPTGAWLADAITTDGDVDWFKFSLASDSLVLITLGRLPGPYRLELYSSCGTRMKVSDRYGKIYEEIAIALSAGSYYVKVSGDGRQYYPGGQPTFHSTTYRLKFRPISKGVVLLSHRGWTHPDGTIEIVGEVLNNTANRKAAVTVTATYYDSLNRVIGTSSTSTHLDIMKPLSRSPFKFDEALRAGYHHYKVRVTSATTTTASPVGVSAFNRDWYTDGAGVFHFTGTIENDHTFTIASPKIAVTLYNKLGKVFNAEAGFTKASTLAPDQRSTFDVTFSDHHAGHNRRVHSSQASR
jgi:hypothetical protein